jgi:hypothetical protein
MFIKAHYKFRPLKGHLQVFLDIRMILSTETDAHFTIK